jgi:hypothetical protein
MKKVVLLCIALSIIEIKASEPGESAQDLVTLRNAEVVSKQVVDDINLELMYLQRYHDAVYDALCLALIMDPHGIVTASEVCLLGDLHLIDAERRMLDNVQKVLAARLLDRNSQNPSPYQMALDRTQAGSSYEPDR